VVLAGEITTNAHVDYIQVARDTIKRIGYDNTDIGIDYKGCAVLVCLRQAEQRHRAGRRPGRGRPEPGRRRPGLMFGYACDETPELMPAPIYLRTAWSSARPTCGATAGCPGCGPTPRARSRCATSTASRIRSTPSCCRRSTPDIDNDKLREAVIEEIIKPVLPKEPGKGKTKYLINPTGRFVIGGPHGDCGLTGRKIIVDTYGGACPHGGGAFSGKDPSKVDRSAAYAARYVAKNVVAAGLARQCQVQVATRSASRSRSTSWCTPRAPGHLRRAIAQLVAEHFDLRPRASSRCSTCCGRSTRRPPPTATSAATSRSSPGKRPTVRRHWPTPPASS
jgi:S-adenosylmethionine synthetase